MFQSINKHKTFLSTTASFFLILEFLSYFYVSNVTDETIKFLNFKNATRFEQHIKFANNHITDSARIFYDREIDTPQMEELMFKASLAQQQDDMKELDILRNKLYKEFLPSYKYMQGTLVRQLHFHLPKAISFLRFHRPSKYGDSLADVRESIMYVNETKKSIHVFEEGRIFNGFRNIYPIFKGKTFVGTVEVSYSFLALQQEVQSVDHSSLLFLINSDLVHESVFKNEMANYKESELAGLSYDKNTLNDQKELTITQIQYINKNIADQVAPKLKEKKKFAILFSDKNIFNGTHLSVEFLPVLNLHKDQVAYIVRYEDDEMVDRIFFRQRMLLITFSLLSFLIAVSVGVLLGRAKKKEETVLKIATNDALTKIYNRYGLKYTLENRIGDFEKYEKKLSVIFFDIDHFKKVNDTYGHDAGDDVLETLAKLISTHIRTSDIFARWGGEEFLIVLPETSLVSASKIAEKLRYIVASYDFITPKHITCSFGVAELIKGETKEQVFKRADELLYKAKESGRNCVVS